MTRDKATARMTDAFEPAEMTDRDVREFVSIVLEAGGDIQAVGMRHYCIDPPADIDQQQELDLLLERFRDRDASRQKIVRYLQSIDRYIPVEQ